MFKVFDVDDYFSEWGTSSFLVGAESVDDLCEHLSEIIGSKRIAKKIIKEKEWRIKVIDHLFTDVPYTILDTFAYLE